MSRWIAYALAAGCLIAGGLLIGLAVREQDTRELTQAQRLLAAFIEEVRSGKAPELKQRRVLTALRELYPIAARATPDERAEIARLLVDQVASEHSAGAMPLWTAAIDALHESVPVPLGDRLASRITGRLELEEDVNLIVLLGDTLRVVSPRVSAQQAEATAQTLIFRLNRADSAHLSAIATTISALADKLSPTTLDRVRAPLMTALRSESEAKGMASLGVSLGDLSHGLRSGGYDNAIQIITTKIANQSGVYELLLLASALQGVASPGVSPPLATRSAEQLVVRLEKERQIPDFLRVALALQTMAPFVPKQDASVLVERLVMRMETSSGPSILRALAFNIGDFKDAASPNQIKQAAKLLMQHALVVEDAETLRTLAAGLAQLGNSAESSREQIVAKAREMLQESEDQDEREDLEAVIGGLRDDDTAEAQADDEGLADFHELLAVDDDDEVRAEKDAKKQDVSLPPALDRNPFELTAKMLSGLALMGGGLILLVAARRFRAYQ